MEKKVGEAQKIGQSCQKLENLVKNWYYMHFHPKKYIKNYKMKFIQNKEDMISYYQLKKNGKKCKGGSKIRSNLSKMRKFGKKICIICILTQKIHEKL